tara:strand:+ start:236 stop:1324 length:1089 start_codon:yes stop_codon:yes gene_type:complete
MSIDFKTFLSIVNHITDARYPVLIRGRHGIGKSTVVYQYAKENGLPVVERRASQMTEGDLLGLPDLADAYNQKITKFCAPDWLAQACNEAVVLFLDEVDRATVEVRQGIFELCDSRKIAGHTLHPDTLIFAAVNGGEHGAQYQVGEMDPAELDRYTVFDVEPTVEDWLNWAGDNVTKAIWDFINSNHQHLEHSDDYEPNKVYPSRRSWERLSQTLVKANVKWEVSPTIYHISASFVGMEAAIAFNDYLREYKNELTVEQLIDDGRIDDTNDWVINEHTAMVEKIKQSKVFNNQLTSSQLTNLASYFVRIPSEVGMLLWTAMGEGDEAQNNIVNFHDVKATDAEGKEVVVQQHIVSVLTAGSN